MAPSSTPHGVEVEHNRPFFPVTMGGGRNRVDHASQGRRGGGPNVIFRSSQDQWALLEPNWGHHAQPCELGWGVPKSYLAYGGTPANSDSTACLGMTWGIVSALQVGSRTLLILANFTRARHKPTIVTRYELGCTACSVIAACSGALRGTERCG